jgi:hypothetical protein
MWDGDKLILYTANQMLNQGQQAIATTLKIPIENVPLPSQKLGYVLPDERLGWHTPSPRGERFRSAR